MNDLESADLARALGHPIRLGFLKALRDSGSLSPTEFSGDSGHPLGNVSYHARALADAGVIEIDEMVPRRGAMEHRYILRQPRAKLVLEVMELLARA
jgi:DNA-binding transcriptional ArsR family regulator